jgi:AcrR family transcriptional regulator
MAVREQVRTGGRSARIQAAVHDAVRALSTGSGQGELSVPMIAARAGVTPSTIYRRWGDLAALMADVAVERMRPIADPLDTGKVASDLAEWLEQYAEEMSSEVGRAMLRDLLGPANPDNPCLCLCRGFATDQLRLISARALARGEPGFDVEAMLDDVVAPILYRILFGGRDLTPAYCRALLARALAR